MTTTTPRHFSHSRRSIRNILTTTFALTLTATLALTPAHLHAAPPLNDQQLTQIDTIIQRGITEKDYPGAVLIIGNGPDTITRAYGHHTYDPTSPAITPDTLFDLASVTKVVGTATAAMALYEDQRLHLDNPVAAYVNRFQANGKQDIRVRDLLTHISGLPAYDSPNNAKKLEGPGITTADALIMRIASLPPRTDPRTTVTYSCLNMLTQARVNENILGTRQDDYLTSRIYQPLGMTNTTYRPTPQQFTNTAPTIRKSDNTDHRGIVHDPLAAYHSPKDHCPGNAGLFSTAPDLARYCEMIANNGNFRGTQIFKPETIREMTRNQSPQGFSNRRGLGWDIYWTPPYATPLNNTDGKRVIAHTGYTGTMIWIDQNTGTYMILLTNRSYPDDNNKSKRGLSRTRRETIKTILQAQPQYTQHFQENP